MTTPITSRPNSFVRWRTHLRTPSQSNSLSPFALSLPSTRHAYVAPTLAKFTTICLRSNFRPSVSMPSACFGLFAGGWLPVLWCGHVPESFEFWRLRPRACCSGSAAGAGERGTKRPAGAKAPEAVRRSPPACCGGSPMAMAPAAFGAVACGLGTWPPGAKALRTGNASVPCGRGSFGRGAKNVLEVVRARATLGAGVSTGLPHDFIGRYFSPT
mmetsp:Transcript_3247/g.9885  ORF Transcript_3247/g.9885 Transcript_3247/m.9885 type:complete len:214 (-) Transcript_3247:1015-1656(-)